MFKKMEQMREKMDISVVERIKATKNHLNKIRWEENIPGIIYSAGKENQMISLKKSDIQALMREIPKGRLATTIFNLKMDKNKKKAIIKEIQYDRTSYNMIHLDFQEVFKDQKIRVKVPIECKGLSECAGIKLGGIFRQTHYFLAVECLPADLPESFVFDIKDLEIGAVVRFSDLTLPKGVKPLALMQEVALSIARQQASA